MSPWKVILATLVIFCSGLITGAVLVKNSSRLNHKPQRAAAAASNTPTNQPGSIWHTQQKEFLKRIDKQLNLKPEQREEIEKIMRESQERTKAIRDKIAPELREEMKKMRDEIRVQLTPDQQLKFDEAMKQQPKARKEDKTEKPDKGEDRRRKETRKEETPPTQQ
jgi:Spy/CpxP family protein refolding chaperone